MEMMLDKKQIWAIFLFKFKMDHKAVETSCTINHTFGPGTPNEHTVHCWLKKFCKDRALKMRSIMAGHQKLTTTNSEDHWNWSSYNHMRSWPRTWLWPFCGSSAFEANWKDENLNKWVPHELMENHHCEVLSFPILHTVMINSVPGPRSSSKALPKAKFSPKKRVLVTVRWSAVLLIHDNFLNPGKIITSENYAQQIDEMH